VLWLKDGQIVRDEKTEDAARTKAAE
jgi:hypothetical protein